MQKCGPKCSNQIEQMSFCFCLLPLRRSIRPFKFGFENRFETSPGLVGVVCNGTGGLRPPVPLPTAMEGRATARLTIFGAILYA